MYHAVLRLFDGKAFFAPVKDPQRIVDMGTGTGQDPTRLSWSISDQFTGIWALDVGDAYPEAHGMASKMSFIPVLT